MGGNPVALIFDCLITRKRYVFIIALKFDNCKQANVASAQNKSFETRCALVRFKRDKLVLVNVEPVQHSRHSNFIKIKHQIFQAASKVRFLQHATAIISLCFAAPITYPLLFLVS